MFHCPLVGDIGAYGIGMPLASNGAGNCAGGAVHGFDGCHIGAGGCCGTGSVARPRQNALSAADVPLRNYSLTHSRVVSC